MFTLLPLLTGTRREHHGHILAQAAELADDGGLVPRLDPRTFALEDADSAHAVVEDGAATGKVIVLPQG